MPARFWVLTLPDQDRRPQGWVPQPRRPGSLFRQENWSTLYTIAFTATVAKDGPLAP
jgi:hypothetical protein